MSKTRTLVVLCGVLVAALVLSEGSTDAQPGRPKAELTPVVEQPEIQPGRAVTVELRVELPEGIHVQSDEPRDPLLIPTVLTLTPPEGVTVEEIIYPPSTDFVQAGQTEPLAVFGHEFTVEVRLALDADVSPGEIVVPGRFRYQACDDTVCFPPARADVEWRLQVVPREEVHDQRRHQLPARKARASWTIAASSAPRH